MVREKEVWSLCRLRGRGGGSSPQVYSWKRLISKVEGGN